MSTPQELRIRRVADGREYSVTIGRYGMTVLRLRDDTGTLLQHATQWIEGGFASTPDWLPAELSAQLSGEVHRLLQQR